MSGTSAISPTRPYQLRINPDSPKAQSALILGATGAVGKHLLRELLASPHYTSVAEFGRRVTPTESFDAAAKAKLEQRTLDFDKLAADDQGLQAKKWDVVFVTYVCPLLGKYVELKLWSGSEPRGQRPVALKRLRRLTGSVYLPTLLIIVTHSWAPSRYVLAAAKAAKSSDPAHKQRVIYCSVRIFTSFILPALN